MNLTLEPENQFYRVATLFGNCSLGFCTKRSTEANFAQVRQVLSSGSQQGSAPAGLGRVTEDGIHHWLAGLPEKLWAVPARESFEASKNSWPLRRHAPDCRDLD